jgi:hypothetical protein
MDQIMSTQNKVLAKIALRFIELELMREVEAMVGAGPSSATPVLWPHPP